MQTQDPPTVQSFESTGSSMMESIKHLLHEGNIRKIAVKQDGRVVAEFPLTFGVVGTALAPALAAIGAITALLADCTIEVEHADQPAQ